MIHYCSRNCGLPAKHLSKKGIYFCDRAPNKCPIQKSKLSKRLKNKPKRSVKIYSGLEKCSYGCNNNAKFEFANGKYCCSSQGANCPFIRIPAGKKISKSLKSIEDNGFSVASNSNKRLAYKRSKDIADDGLNGNQRLAIKTAIAKTSKINPITGLNVHETTGIKYSEWTKSEKAKDTLIRMATEQSRKMKIIDKETGLTEAQRRSFIGVQTKIGNIDDNGLNSFDRANLKCIKSSKHKGQIYGLYYQSSNERRFIELLKSMNQIHNLSRGPTFHYLDENGTKRWYISDFILNGDIIFEIKSTYTLFGVDGKYIKSNLAKLKAVVEAGYGVYVVLDDIVKTYEEIVEMSLKFL